MVIAKIFKLHVSFRSWMEFILQTLRQSLVLACRCNSDYFAAGTDGQSASMELLIRAGADVNAASKAGETPLIIAADTGQSNPCKKLLKLVCPLPEMHRMSLIGICPVENLE